jgi:glycosyltransferase involved in cell wall biosynthesis
LNHAHKPNLLILTSSFPRNGGDDTCGYVREFARALSPDFSVTVLAPPDSCTDDPIGDGLRVIRSWSPVPSRWEQFRGTVDLSKVAGGSILTRLLFGLSLICYAVRALVLALSADVICCHWMAPCGVIGLLCGSLVRRPFVIIEHSGALHLLRTSRAGAWLARLLVTRSSRTYVVSNDLRLKLASIADVVAPKVEVIPMGVDCASYSPGRAGQEPASGRCIGADEDDAPGERRFKVLFIGRLTEIKGAEVLIRAVSEMPGTDLTIAGEGDSRDWLAALARELGVQATFTGQVDRIEKRRLLADCDAVVIPSKLLNGERAEGLPVVLLEAMAAGKPVIASRCGGLTDVIVDGDNGLLFDADDEQMLAARLRELLAEPAMRRRLGTCAAISAARYDWLVIGEKFRRSIGEAL